MIRHTFVYRMARGQREISLEPLCCLHIGALNCDWPTLLERLAAIRRDPTRLTLVMGDIGDSIYPGPTEKRYDPDTIDPRYYPPHKAYEKFVQLIEPIHRQGKVIGYHTGNHDETWSMRSGFNVVRDWVVRQLPGATYLGWLAVTRFIVKDHRGRTVRTYYINSHHGSFTGNRLGGAINRTEDRGRAWDSDITLRGHCHQIGGSKKSRYQWSLSKGKKQVFALCGSFYSSYLECAASYAEKKDLEPLETGTITVLMRPYENKLGLVF